MLTRAQFLGLLLAPQAPGTERQIDGEKYCWAPPGSFRMGSPVTEPDRRFDEGPVDATLTEGFWVGKYEVTQGQRKAVVGVFPREPDKGVGDRIPVYWVSYPEAEDFCRKLTARARRQLSDGWEFRLPTEAQWEYASRAGTATATSFDDRFTDRQINFNGVRWNGGPPGRSRNASVEAGSYPPNPWRIHDMHGSVWEWCRDWYHATLPGGTDPDNSQKQGEKNRDGTYSRVRRGGAWIENGTDCRSARRLRYEPERRSDHIGFRVVAVRVK